MNRKKKASVPGDKPLDTVLIKKTNDILKARAKELAHDQQEDFVAENVMEVLEFILANERYAVESIFIREVYPMKEFTPIPGLPEFVLGLINIRGQILSVIDIRRFFDLPMKGLSDLNRVIVIHTRKMEMGILADRIVGVHYVPIDVIQPSLPTLSGIRSEYLKGITGDGLVILDVQKMLSDKKLSINDFATTHSEPDPANGISTFPLFPLIRD